MQFSTQEMKADINVTPLVDVVLVLLIIFMVVTPMIVSHNVQIPETSHPQKQSQPAQKIIYLNDDGGLFFEEAPVHPEILLGRLQEIFQTKPQTAILLQADRRLSYEKVMEAVDLISQSGFPTVGLIAKPKGSDAGIKNHF